jgi:purine-binding chemotaxis protein CheW
MNATVQELKQLLTFEQRGEEHALPLLRVREVVEYGSVTRLPATAPWVLGVIDLRGRVVPVIDLAAKLGLGAGPSGPRRCIVLVEADVGEPGVVVGVLVDAVLGVLELGDAEVAGIAAEAGNRRCRYELEHQDGTGGTSRRIWLLDLDAILLGGEGAEASPAALPGSGVEGAELDRAAGDGTGPGAAF